MNRDNFKWTDELVKKFLAYYIISGNEVREIDFHVFKTAHAPSDSVQDWEIVSLKYLPDGKTYPFNIVPTNDKFIIFSVLRKSDGVVFSVGDKIDSDYNGKFTISKIYLTDNWKLLQIMGKSPDGTTHVIPIISAKPLPKRTKLAQTSDGKDLFEGDEFFFLFTDNTIGRGIARPTNDWSDRRCYSTKEAAMCSIPCLSVNEVHQCLCTPSDIIGVKNRLIELAKSKQ